MTEKNIRFCEEYLVDLNGKQAAIRTGYSENRAEVTACELLNKQEIQDYLEKRNAQITARLQLNQDRILREYARVAFSDIRNYYNQDGTLKPIQDLDEDQAAALAGIESDEIFATVEGGKVQVGVTKKIKIYDKVKALDSLSRHFGMFQDRMDVTSRGDTLNRKPDLSKLSLEELALMAEIEKKIYHVH